jgi:hypothetical protein
MCNWLYKWYRPDGKLTPDEIASIFVDLLEQGYLRRQRERPDPILRALQRLEGRITQLDYRLERDLQRQGKRGRNRKV